MENLILILKKQRGEQIILLLTNDRKNLVRLFKVPHTVPQHCVRVALLSKQIYHAACMLCAERTSQLCELVIFFSPVRDQSDVTPRDVFSSSHRESDTPCPRAHLNYSTHARECKAAHI